MDKWMKKVHEFMDSGKSNLDAEEIAHQKCKDCGACAWGEDLNYCPNIYCKKYWGFENE